MLPIEALNALMEGKTVQLTNDAFKGLLDEFATYHEKPDNSFLINSIEQSCISLFNFNTQEVYYDIGFEFITLSF